MQQQPIIQKFQLQRPYFDVHVTAINSVNGWFMAFASECNGKLIKTTPTIHYGQDEKAHLIYLVSRKLGIAAGLIPFISQQDSEHMTLLTLKFLGSCPLPHQDCGVSQI